jgi:hypothetical protein
VSTHSILYAASCDDYLERKMDLGVSEKLKPILAEVKQFIDTEILPMEPEYHEEIEKEDRWHFT